MLDFQTCNIDAQARAFSSIPRLGRRQWKWCWGQFGQWWNWQTQHTQLHSHYSLGPCMSPNQLLCCICLSLHEGPRNHPSFPLYILCWNHHHPSVLWSLHTTYQHWWGSPNIWNTWLVSCTHQLSDSQEGTAWTVHLPCRGPVPCITCSDTAFHQPANLVQGLSTESAATWFVWHPPFTNSLCFSAKQGMDPWSLWHCHHEHWGRCQLAPLQHTRWDKFDSPHMVWKLLIRSL